MLIKRSSTSKVPEQIQPLWNVLVEDTHVVHCWLLCCGNKTTNSRIPSTTRGTGTSTI